MLNNPEHVMDPKEIELVQSSWRAVEPIAPQAAALFYSNLFDADPELKALFKGDMTQQGAKLMQMIGAAVRGLSDVPSLLPVLQALGARHRAYGVAARDYDVVGGALLDTLAQGLGPAFTPDVQQAWATVYQTMATVMMQAAEQGHAAT